MSRKLKPQQVPLPLDYIVFQMDDVEKLYKIRHQLSDKMAYQGVEDLAYPLYIRKDDTIYYFSEDEEENCGDAFLEYYEHLKKEVEHVDEDLAESDAVYGTIAVFRVKDPSTSLSSVFSVYHVLEDLNYCVMYGIYDMKYVVLRDGAAAAVVTVGTE